MSDSVNVRFEMGSASIKLKKANEDLYEVEQAEVRIKQLLESAAFYRNRAAKSYSEAVQHLKNISGISLDDS